MRRTLLLVGLLAVASLSAVGLAQPPASPPQVPPGQSPPRPLPSNVAGSQPPRTDAAEGTAPSAAARPAAEAPITRFETLAAFPATTQTSVRSVLLGSAWLTRMNQSQGRFLVGYRPALRQPIHDDSNLKQAFAALALARAAKFAGDDRQSAIASQAVLALLAMTKVDAADANCRIPMQSSRSCNRVGFASALALDIYELPGADEKLIGEAERLCQFLRKQLRPDGSIHYTDGPNDNPMKVDPAGVNEYPGLALQALAIGNRMKPASWKVDAVKKGVGYYRGVFKAHPHPLLVATLTPGCTEYCLQNKSTEAAAFVFEMNDWLAGLQYQPTDPRYTLWAGGFRGWANGQPDDVEPSGESGLYLQSMACAYQLTRQNADLNRAGRYRQCLFDAVQFSTGLQYVESNTRHFENAFRANTLIGGFHLSPSDGNLRIDATAHAVTGLLQFLASGAEQE